jgi:flagellar hook-basal body complex protein FliE
MISSNITGASAYAAIQGGIRGLSGTSAETAPAEETSFGSALQGALTKLTDMGRDADAKSVQAMSGNGSLTDVVMAVSKVEMAMQASIAVRDKVISAYQDVMRMSV